MILFCANSAKENHKGDQLFFYNQRSESIWNRYFPAVRNCLIILCVILTAKADAGSLYFNSKSVFAYNQDSVLSSNADLSALAVSCGTLTPKFNSTITSYTVLVPNNTPSIVIAPTVADPGVSKVTVGEGSSSIALSVGNNVINTVITAEDGKTTKTYSITVIRLQIDNPFLSVLKLSAGKLMPDFQPATTSYTALVSNTTASVKLIIADADSSVKVNGKALSEKDESDSVYLSIGSNRITATITAPDETIRTYIITVTRDSPEAAAALTQTMIFKPLFSKTYGDPNFIPEASTSSGLPVSYSSDNPDVAQIINGKICIMGAGTAAITASQIGDSQYQATTPITQILTVNKAVLTITAVDKSRLEGRENPVLSFTCSGFVNSENENIFSAFPVLKTSATAGSVAGTYPITISGAVADDYIFKFIDAVLTIVPASSPNSAPTLSAIPDQKICYSTLRQSIPLTGISSGSGEQASASGTVNLSGETKQNIILSIVSGTPGIIRDLEIIQTGTTGIINYIPDNKDGGATTITVKIKDDGGTDKGGIDTLVRKFTITISPLPVISIISSQGINIASGTATNLNASGGKSYRWSDAAGILAGQNTATLTVQPSVSTTYTVTAFSDSGCTTTKSITLNISKDYKKLEVNNVITPNGDGINDKLVIKDLEKYPNNTINIFDRLGRKIYKMQHYDNNWDGRSNGTPLSEDSYYYIIDLGSGIKLVKGFVSIITGN